MHEKSEGHKLRMRILDNMAKSVSQSQGGWRVSSLLWCVTIQAMDDLYHLHWRVA